MKKITLILAAVLAFSFTYAQTSLTAGDIAFVGTGVDSGGPFTDYVSFVLLKDIDAATQIIFTDRGWSDTTGFGPAGSGDGELTWTSGIARSAGDVISLNLSFGQLSNSGSYAIQGDQLFAIQGSIASPIFIAGLHFNVEPLGATGGTVTTNDTNWDGNNINNDESALPNALITGDTAVRLFGTNGTEQDNFQFSCTLAGSNPITGTPAQIRAILHNTSNWNFNNSSGFNPPIESGCTITVAAAADSTPPVITCAATPADITAGIDGMAAIPDLVSGSSATDNVSAPGDITITQSPTAGSMVGVGVTMVTVTAMDEAGNSASCMINVTVLEPPSTTLAAGDIAFVAFNLDGSDSFAFILLVDIIAGTNIKFTDCGVTNPNSITCSVGDSSSTWYAPTALTAGTIINLDGTFFPGGPLAAQGDQILAYQGTMAMPTFLAGIHSNVEAGTTSDGDWDGGVTMLDESALPDQLTNGVNAIRVHASETEVDNWQLDCSLIPSGLLTGTKMQIAAIINDLQYWTSNNTTEFSPVVNPACIFTVVVDTTPPTITCPTVSAAALDANCENSLPDYTSFPTVTDNLDPNPVVTQDPAPGTVHSAAIDVTLTATDASGNSASCMFTVDVVDAIPPTAVCQNITVQLDASGNASIMASDVDGGSSDNCGIASLSVSPNTFDASNLGNNTVTLTVADTNNNMATCTATVTVEDNVAPSITCPTVSDAALDANCQNALPDYTSFATVSDNADANPVVTQDPAPGTVHSTAIDVTLTAMDASGNSAFCTFTLGVVDAIPPTITCPPNVMRTSSMAVVLTGGDIGTPTTGDNCGVASVVGTRLDTNSTDLTTDPYQQGVTIIQWVVTDTSGLTSMCNQTVTVSSPPTVNVPNVVDQTQAAAESAIVGAGLTVGTVGTANSNTIAAGNVISQDPVGGTSVAPGSSVDLVVSLGSACMVMIDTQPMDAMVLEGATNVDFTVVASGTGTLSYNWEFSSDGGTTFFDVNPATDGNPTFTLGGPLGLAASGNQYRVVVTSDNGTPGDPSDDCEVTSDAATLTVSAVPCMVMIDTQPMDAMVLEGATNVDFTVVASGTGTLSYNWEFSSDGGTTFFDVNPATDGNPIFTLGGPLGLAASGNQYRVVVTSDNGTPGDPSDDCEVTSDAATLTVSAVPCMVMIDTQPMDAMVLEGATNVDFTVVASGTGTLSYNWEFSSDGGTTFFDVNPATDGNPTFTLGGPLGLAASGNQYRVVVTSDNDTPGDPSDDCEVTSDAATLTVSAVPCMVMIDTQPMDAEVCEGATNVDFTVAASGTGTLSYNWEFSSDGGTTFFDVNPATDGNPTFTLGGPLGIAASGNQYRVVVTSDNGTPGDPGDDCEVTSDAVTLSVNANPAPMITGPNSYPNGGSGVTLDAGAGYVSYLWSPGGQNTQTIGNALAGTYSVTVIDANGCEGTSPNFVVTEDPPAVLSITGFNLIDADNDVVLQTIMHGDIIDVSTLPTMNLSIEALATSDAESVRLELTGPKTAGMTENVVPYSLFGDISGDFSGMMFDLGDYNVMATPYSADNLGGMMGTALDIDFSIVDNPACVDFDAYVDSTSNPSTCGGADGSITIIVENFNNPVGYTVNGGPAQGGGGTINITGLTAGNYTVEISDDSGCEATVMVTLTDPTPPMVTLAPFADVDENDPAFALTGGMPMGGTYSGTYSGTGVSGGMFDPQAVGEGTYLITYTYTDSTTNCTNSASQSITVLGDTPTTLAVTSFNLINADTEMVIQVLMDGDVLDLNTLPTDNFSIEAVTTPDVESVLMELSGDKTSSRIENVAPYAAFGDVGSDFLGMVLGVGSYAIMATPYSGNGLSGTMGTGRTANFTIVDNPGPDTTPPVISLLGSNPQNITQGDPYMEQGATALDNIDGDISGLIMIDASAVDVNTLGSYPVTYNVMDAAGNAAIEVIRTVIVMDVVEETSLSVLDSSDDSFLFFLSDQQMIPLSEVDGLLLGIVFDPEPGATFVSFDLTGPINQSRNEGLAPFSLFGDFGVDVQGAIFPVGTYTLIVDPNVGPTITVEFTIFNDIPPALPPPNQLSIWPNPAVETVNMGFDIPTELIELKVFDLQGRLIRRLQVERRNGQYEVPVYDLPTGTYFIKTLDTRGQQFQEQMIIER